MLPKTKIVCTIGPSTWDPEVLKQLIDNGMTVARVNGAFADVEEMRKVSNLIRAISKDVALMIDIKGHELRLNKFENDVDVKAGDIVTLGSDESEYIYVQTYPVLYQHVHPGVNILVDDGRTILVVEKIEDKKIYARVISGNKIPKGKGINVPGIFLDNPPITDRDREQILFAVEDKWDFVAESFVRNKKDVEAVKELLLGSHTKVIAKIEDGFGIENISEIIASAEGIMVARGDLGVEIPYSKVPYIQKEIVKKCNKCVKPVIVATQMLETMITNPRPTRAEISDVANAIYDGADAVMLSGETTAGKYPVECVKVMRDIALETENYIYSSTENSTSTVNLICEIRDEGTELAISIAKSVSDISHKDPDAKIVVFTRTGFTAKLISAYEIRNSIIAITPFDYYARRLAMFHGIKAITWQDPNKNLENMNDLEIALREEVINRGFVKSGERIIVVIAASYNFASSNGIHEKASIKILSI